MNRLKYIFSRTSGYLSRIWNRQLLVFLFFLLLSSIFWIFTAGKEVREEEFEVEVRLVGVPDNVVVTTEPPRKLSLKLKDEVFTLLNYKYRKKFSVTIDWNNVATPSGHVRLLTPSLIKPLLASLQTSTEVVSCRPDTVDFYYNYGQSKWVNVIFQGSVTADSLYHIIASELTPRRVQVYASKHILDTITGAYLVPVACDNLTDTTVMQVDFQKVRGAKFIPSRAKLTVYADRMVEKTVSVPVRGVNFPAGKSLRTFPANVDVTFLVGTSQYKRITDESFTIVVNYEDLLEDNDNRIDLRLKSLPYGVQHARIKPGEVEYIIEETGE